MGGVIVEVMASRCNNMKMKLWTGHAWEMLGFMYYRRKIRKDGGLEQAVAIFEDGARGFSLSCERGVLLMADYHMAHLTRHKLYL
jgi:hypothetical protein